MSVLFYMDHHVNAAITKGLKKCGVDVVTTTQDGTALWDDENILDRATQLGRVVFTHDDDFLVIAADWLDNGKQFAGVIYAHQLNITIGRAINDLELIAKVLLPVDMENRIEYLPYT